MLGDVMASGQTADPEMFGLHILAVIYILDLLKPEMWKGGNR